MKSSNISYIPALDHLRFFAASIVVVYHGILVFGFFQNDIWAYSSNPFYTFFIEGHSAVSLFMVLSGFLFTVGSSGKAIDYFGFLRNRFFRIYPLFIALIIAGLFFYPENFSFKKLLMTLFLMANLPEALDLGPFSSTFWTISVEFQFYLLFPFLALALRQYGYKIIFVLLIASLVARAVAVLVGTEMIFVWFSTLLGRIDQFLLGMAAAKLFGSMPEKRWGVFLVPALALAIAMSWVFNWLGGWVADSPWLVLWPIVEGAIWSFLLIAYVSAFRECNGFLGGMLARLGEVSYSMYLIHTFIWYIIFHNNLDLAWSANPIENSFVNSILIVLPLTVAVSVVTYNLIEKPFLRFRTKYLKPL